MHAYRHDIDGLRGIAVLLVVLYHAGGLLPGGFVGVDVFFVISGFLITRLIQQDLARGSFSLAEFWARRVRRLVPALAVTVALTLVAGYWLCWLDEYADLGASALAQQGLASNIYFWRTSSYFALEAEWKPLMHTWSLAIEEQFYLFLPPGLVWLARLGCTATCTIFSVVGALSFLLCALPHGASPSAIFFLLPTRGWELIIGCLLAFAGARLAGSTATRTVAALGGLAAIALPAVLFNSQTRFPGASALLPTLGTALVLYAGSGNSNPVSHGLGRSPLAALGLISYSLYLLHWPALSLATNWLFRPPSTSASLFIVALTCIVAWAMWKWIEQPLRRPNGPLRGARAWWTLACSTALIASMSLFVWKSGGVPSRFAPDVLQALEASRDVPRGMNHALGDLRDGRLRVAGAADSKKFCLLWGDSHAEHFAPGLDAACQALGIGLVQATHAATPPVQDLVFRQPWGLGERGPAFAEEVLAWAATARPAVVVAAANWEFYVNLPGFEERLRTTCQRLRKHGARVVLLRDTPLFPVPVPLAVARALARGEKPEDIRVSRTKHDRLTEPHTAALERAVGDIADIVDPSAWFEAAEGDLRAVAAGRILFHDIRHLSRTGSLSLKPYLQALVAGPTGAMRLAPGQGADR